MEKIIEKNKNKNYKVKINYILKNIIENISLIQKKFINIGDKYISLNGDNKIENHDFHLFENIFDLLYEIKDNHFLDKNGNLLESRKHDNLSVKICTMDFCEDIINISYNNTNIIDIAKYIKLKYILASFYNKIIKTIDDIKNGSKRIDDINISKDFGIEYNEEEGKINYGKTVGKFFTKMDKDITQDKNTGKVINKRKDEFYNSNQEYEEHFNEIILNYFDENDNNIKNLNNCFVKINDAINILNDLNIKNSRTDNIKKQTKKNINKEFNQR